MFTTATAMIALALAPPASAAAAQDSKGIVQIVAESPDFQTLYSCIQAADMGDAFDEDGPYTVFAPSDEAFAKLPKETIDGLLKDKDTLARILKYHIVPAKITARDLDDIDRITLKTLLDDGMVLVSKEGDEVKVGEARVTMTNLDASNGVIHVIDSVLMPPDS